MADSARPLDARDEEITRLTARLHDLEAERALLREGEAARLESERRLALYSGTMTDVIWTSDLYFRWNYMSPSVKDLLGYTPEEALALTPADTLTPASLAVAMANLEAGLKVIFADRSIVRWPNEMEIEQIRKDGSTVWTEVRVTVMRTDDGTPYGFLGVTRDISRRKAAEDALVEMKRDLERLVETRTAELVERDAYLRALGEYSGDILSIVDRTGTVHYYSASTFRILGFTPEEFVGRKVWELLHPDDIAKVASAIEDLFAHPDRVARVEYRYRHKDGHYRTLESLGHLMPDRRESGRFVVTSRDMTGQRQLEAEAARARKIESIGLLAGGIAHDFNNILTVVLGNLGLLRRAVGDAPRPAEWLDRAETACARARELTLQLLTFARGGAPLRRAASFRDLLVESAQFALAGSNVRLSFDLPGDLHPARVDPGQMSRVIGNLLINAREAMPEGGTVEVRARNVELSAGDAALPPGPYLDIAIADDGPGIPAEHRDKVFDPYFTTKPAGTGLGLAVAHSIVARHEGRLSLDSPPGGGTCFRMLLPAAAGEAVETDEPAPPDARPLSGRVLVMDDEPEILATLMEILATLGLAVTGAPDGEAALSEARRAAERGTPFHAAVLDLTVRGGMGGKEAARLLRRLSPSTALVVSSGYSADPVMAAPAAHGFDDLLPKPWSRDAAERILRRAIERAAP